MSESTTNDAQPIFSLQKLYIKDCSFENPNAPTVFTTPSEQPHIELNLSLNHQQLDTEHWEVTLHISVITRDQESQQLLFEIELEHAGLFYMSHIDEAHLPLLLGVECPTILFPYTRQLISQLTVDGGFMPLLLEPINFRAAFEESQMQQESEAVIH